MNSSKSHIIAHLQKEILSLQGLGSKPKGTQTDVGLGIIGESFPNQTFPLGVIHEFIANGLEGITAATGFVSGITSRIMRNGGVSVWINSGEPVYPIALKQYGIEPDKVIFIHLQQQKQIQWVLEESLKCEGLASVIAEMRDLSFVSSRRLQLAVEQSRVTGFILRRDPRHLQTTASVCRWEIDSLPSQLADQMPGVGFPRWKVSLTKVRNGKPGQWDIEWREEKFHILKEAFTVSILGEQRKTG